MAALRPPRRPPTVLTLAGTADGRRAWLLTRGGVEIGRIEETRHNPPRYLPILPPAPILSARETLDEARRALEGRP